MRNLGYPVLSNILFRSFSASDWDHHSAPLQKCQGSLATSEMGQTEKSGRSTGKSALPPTPDMALHRANRRFVPLPDVLPMLHFARRSVTDCQSKVI